MITKVVLRVQSQQKEILKSFLTVIFLGFLKYAVSRSSWQAIAYSRVQPVLISVLSLFSILNYILELLHVGTMVRT